jgi:hypothetical protein
VTSAAIPPLAYVFWHCPQAGSSAAGYQADLLAFHAELAADPPAGFVRSGSARLAAASWFAASAEVYEDWYLVRDWAAVGTLNLGAVDAAHLISHDRVARQVAAGAGGIYLLRAGDIADGHGFATWFAKPAGWSQADLDASLAALLNDGTALWQRQMVLGPAPEFCLQSRESLSLPAGIGGEQIGYRPLP